MAVVLFHQVALGDLFRSKPETQGHFSALAIRFIEPDDDLIAVLRLLYRVDYYVLFVHTGGSPALYVYMEEILS